MLEALERLLVQFQSVCHQVSPEKHIMRRAILFFTFWANLSWLGNVALPRCVGKAVPVPEILQKLECSLSQMKLHTSGWLSTFTQPFSHKDSYFILKTGRHVMARKLGASRVREFGHQNTVNTPLWC